MSKIQVKYEKIFTDDTGKKVIDIFGGDATVITLKTLWCNIVDGFFSHNNTSVSIMAITGNIRVVVVSDESGDRLKFEQFFLSSLDGKMITVPANVKYAIQNIDEGKSTHAIGSDDIPNMDFANKSIFNWRKKQP
jgi:hypothetical protein